jgi:UDP-N-acetyl-D-glucosamine dehydrogenase
MGLLEKLKNRSAAAGVVGLGYVGLPLAVELAQAGYRVTGIDSSATKVAAVNAGRNYINDVDSAVLAQLVSSGNLNATTDYGVISQLDAVSICVPTPLSKSREPDISYILAACNGITPCMHKELLIVLESTSYPGTTKELVLPLLQKSGLKVGQDFFLAFSPERVDPGNASYNTRNTPKIIGGITNACTEMATAFYAQAIDTVVPVSCATTEMVKLLENTFRAINIGAINEMALICNQLGVDVWEIIEAAKTKPFGFMPFYPGPGLGGHCIPIDPLYLSWKMRKLNYQTRFIELADQINSSMPHYVVERVVELVNKRRIPITGAKILVLGVAYKPDIEDDRESPALPIIEKFIKRGGEVTYNDPFIPRLEYNGVKLESAELTPEMLQQQDIVVVVTNHSSYDWGLIVSNAKLIFDTRNGLAGFANLPQVYKL